MGRKGCRSFELFVSCGLGSAAQVLCASVKQDNLPCVSVRRQLQVSELGRMNSAFHKATCSFAVLHFESHAYGRGLMGTGSSAALKAPTMDHHAQRELCAYERQSYCTMRFLLSLQGPIHTQ